jgi:hypothetical protein
MPLDRSLKQDRLEQLRVRYNRSILEVGARLQALETAGPPSGGGAGVGIDGGTPSTIFGPYITDGGTP